MLISGVFIDIDEDMREESHRRTKENALIKWYYIQKGLYDPFDDIMMRVFKDLEDGYKRRKIVKSALAYLGKRDA